MVGAIAYINTSGVLHHCIIPGGGLHIALSHPQMLIGGTFDGSGLHHDCIVMDQNTWLGNAAS